MLQHTRRLREALSDALDAVDNGLGHRPRTSGNAAVKAATLLEKILLTGLSDIPPSEILDVRAELLRSGSDGGGGGAAQQSLSAVRRELSAYTGGDAEVNQSLMDMLLGNNTHRSTVVGTAVGAWQWIC